MSTPQEPLVERRAARGVVTLTLNRPQAFNALSEGMLEALQSEIDALARDESARAWSWPRPARHSAPATISRRCARGPRSLTTAISSIDVRG